MPDFNYLPIQSSNLVEAAYDAESQTCRIRFKNGLYEYPNFPASLWTQFSATFQAAESTGKFFAKNIRPMKYVKIS